MNALAALGAWALAALRRWGRAAIFFLDLLRLYVGRTNITPETIDNLHAQLQSGIAVLRGRNLVATLGGQIIDCQITSIAQNPLLLDHLTIVLRPQYPIPLNNPELYLVI